MLELSQRIASDDFARLARHPEHPRAFTRRRLLPLPSLIAVLLSMRNQSLQAMLDGFYASVRGHEGLLRGVSDRAFAKARDHLHQPALVALNDWLVQRAEAAGRIVRWCGLRVVAGDASALRPAVRACRLRRGTVAGEQRLFALYLPGAELTLHASLHSAALAERSMLMEALDGLGPDDVLVLDRGYPATWLVALLNARGIRFVMRCDNDSGWAAVKAFMRSHAAEAAVTLKAPRASDVRDWGCPAGAPALRLVRQTAPNGRQRVLATNLDPVHYPAASFGDLYHQRWRIEEAFKRLKHRLHLEAVSGLSQQALIIEAAAKILADNLASLMCASAADDAALAARSRKCNRSYAVVALQRALPRLLLAIGDVAATLANLLARLAANNQRFIRNRSRPRPARHGKPHPSCVYKG